MNKEEQITDKEFYKHKKLTEMNEAEWEALCDGCGKCCFHKIIDGYGKKKKILDTRIACNLLDLATFKCSDYCNRFNIQKSCIKLNKKNVAKFDWLPDTCAYRLIFNGQPLPSWHPLLNNVSDNNSVTSTKSSTSIPPEHLIQNPVHEKDVDDWYDYIIDKDISETL